MTDAKPILFSTAMVQAILAGRKVATRRVVKDSGLYAIDDAIHGVEVASRERIALATRCPHGRPGDLLWVKEAWRVGKPADGKPGSVLWPRTDDKGITVLYVAGGWRSVGPTWRIEPIYPDNEPMPRWAGRYRHARFMPRWASRITLRIKDVRVERLQEISEADAIAEGVERVAHPKGLDEPAWKSYEIIHEGRHKGKPNPHSAVPNRSAITSYRELWESLNGPKSWDANPFVWVVFFERVTDSAKAVA